MGRITLAPVDHENVQADEIDKLDRRLFPNDDPVYKPGSFWWLLCDDGEPIGFCGVRIIESGYSGFLYRAGVLPQYRGMGLHTKMIRARERWCRKQELTSCVTYIAPWNISSLNNLVKCGYKGYKPTYLFGGSPETVVYLRKDL